MVVSARANKKIETKDFRYDDGGVTGTHPHESQQADEEGRRWLCARSRSSPHRGMSGTPDMVCSERAEIQ